MIEIRRRDEFLTAGVGYVREEIERAVARADRARRHLRRWVLGGMASPLLVGCLGFFLYERYPYAHADGMLLILTYLAVGVMLGSILAAGPLLALQRRRSGRRIRRRLEGLSPAEQAALLKPLAQSRDEETRALVAPLLRGLRLPAELTPAGPEGRGTEASPVERETRIS